MDAETLEALKGSIAHWERIVAGEEPSQYGGNCALCQTFPNDMCAGCPVAEDTGRPDCVGTPFYHFVDYAEVRETGGRWPELWATNESAKRAAQAELDFLKSLLPEASKQEVA